MNFFLEIEVRIFLQSILLQEYHDHAAQYIEPGDVTTSQPEQKKNGPQVEWLTKDVWQLGIWAILAVILVGSAYVSYHQR